MKCAASYLLTLLLLMIASSCAVTHELEVTMLEPAAIDLQQNITRIGILNGSMAENREAPKDHIEKWISKEDQKLSAQGQHAAISGLQEALTADGRFDTIVYVKDTPEILVGLDTRPEQAAWERIASICKEHKLDAVFALASYDMESQVKMKKTSYLALDLIRVRNKIKGHVVTVETLIENGWRIYEPETQTVLDEFIFTGEIVSKGQGKTPARALENLGSRYDDFVLQSKEDGTSYGARLRPMEQTIPREYYIKGSPDLEKAHAFVESQDWDKAVDLWTRDIASGHAKPASRASYNLAVWYEYKGEIKQALVWAQKAEKTLPSKRSKAYISHLQERKEKEVQLQAQLVQTDFIE